MPDKPLQSIPKVREFLMGIEIFDVLDKIVEQYNIPQEREEEFLDLTDAVMNGKIAVSKMPEFIEQAFGVSAEDAKTISIQLVGHRLLPLESYLGGMEEQLKTWGGNVEDFPELRIKEDPITVISLLREQANTLGLELPEHLMKRFVYLAKGYISKERSKDATETLLKRPLNIGGLGMSAEHVTKLFRWLETLDLSTAVDYKADEKEDKTSVISTEPVARPVSGEISEEIPPTPAEPVVTAEPPATIEPPATTSSPKGEKSIQEDLSSAPPPQTEYRKPLPKATKKASPPALIPTKALATEVPVIAGELMEDHEKQEITAHAKKLKKIPPAPVVADASKIEEKAVALLLEHASNKKLSKKQALALAGGVLTGRLETGRLYQQLKEVYGFDTTSAQAVMKPLVELRQEWETSHKAPSGSPMAGGETLRHSSTDERSLMDRRHAALTKTPSKQSVEPVLPGARVSAARTKEEELAVQHQNVDVTAEKVAKDKDRPSRVKVKLSRSSVPPKPQPKEKPTVTDVKFTPTLVGPVEELGTMTVADFRRLAPDPAESARKVLDTLQLLEETAYEERISGITAWRKSPLSQLYLEMVQEGLRTGSSVAEVASVRRNQGKESLSPTELQAIVSINAQVKY